MIPEIAILNGIPEKTAVFEASFEKALEIISGMKGYRRHQLQQNLTPPTDMSYWLNGSPFRTTSSDSGNPPPIRIGKNCLILLFPFPRSGALYG
jgi:hypothetical protein